MLNLSSTTLSIGYKGFVYLGQVIFWELLFMALYQDTASDSIDTQTQHAVMTTGSRPT